MSRAVLTLLITLMSGVSSAEYRVYELEITDTESGSSRTVITTLDHLQYPGYFPMRATESIVLVDTWMCRGRHGEFKKACPNPRGEVAPAPSTSSEPQAGPLQP